LLVGAVERHSFIVGGADPEDQKITTTTTMPQLFSQYTKYAKSSTIVVVVAGVDRQGLVRTAKQTEEDVKD
jgi:predicted Zn-dependent peptidase